MQGRTEAGAHETCIHGGLSFCVHEGQVSQFRGDGYVLVQRCSTPPLQPTLQLIYMGEHEVHVSLESQHVFQAASHHMLARWGCGLCAVGRRVSEPLLVDLFSWLPTAASHSGALGMFHIIHNA